jgi:hypothetical protein
MDINMVFMIPVEFRAPTEDVTELALGVWNMRCLRSQKIRAHT